MKVLYGVQATGNGHITRARLIAKALEKTNIEVDWVFSGRKPDEYFDMEIFQNKNNTEDEKGYRTFRGMTFAIDDGNVNFIKTVLTNNAFTMISDIKSLDISEYDLILSDFEPITAWAAKLSKKECIGLSHQSSFLFDIPKKHNNFVTDIFMKQFAPVSLPIGIHWHHFNGQILPPIVEDSTPTESENFVLVYLPFACLDTSLALLEQHPQQKFVIYSGVPEAQNRAGHIDIKPFSRNGFQRDLRACDAVISGGGFELPSEALHLGKRLLIQPITGQMEQQSNGFALQQLELATVTDTLDYDVINQWLALPAVPRKPFPHTAQAFVTWLEQGDWSSDSVSQLQAKLWSEYDEISQ